MLPLIADWLGDIFGPLRLFRSRLFLAALAAGLGAALTFWLLPRFWSMLPRDRGRAFAVGSEASVGKPMGAGLIFVPVFAFLALLVTPLAWPWLLVVACVLASMVVGYLDDRVEGGYSEYVLGAFDLVVSVLVAVAVCQMLPFDLWLPLVSTPWTIPPWLFIAGGSVLVWTCINATNASDGVDGLSGSLSMISLLALGTILYSIVGHREVADHLLVPHYPSAPDWALLAFGMAGCLAAYLWYNAHPSEVLMGDAGSRPIGLLVGVLVLASGNPFLVLVVAGVVLLNGGTGLVKVALLRFLRIGIFGSVRFPLHDHVRQRLGWSNTQVMMRFVLIQALGLGLLMVLLFKLR